MPKLPGVNHLDAVRVLEKAGSRVAGQGRRIVMTYGTRPDHSAVSEDSVPGYGVLEGAMPIAFRVELEQEAKGRWVAEVVELPGVLAFGATQDHAIAQVQALALRVVADRLEHDEAGREFLDISFAAA